MYIYEIYEMQTIETRVCLLSQRYTSNKQTGIPEHVGGKIEPTPSPELPKQLEESLLEKEDKKPVMLETINEEMAVESAPAVQQVSYNEDKHMSFPS